MSRRVGPYIINHFSCVFDVEVGAVVSDRSPENCKQQAVFRCSEKPLTCCQVCIPLVFLLDSDSLYH